MLKPFRCHKNCQCWCLVIIVLGYANLVLINLLTSDNFFCVNQFYFGSYHSLVKCLKEKETKEDIIRAESTTLPLIKGVVSPHNFSLDAVITYVNGSDPYFAAELRNAEMTRLNETKLPFSASSNRFSDNSDLLFLLRSLEKFGDIFRYIWLVVAFETQIPQWLNISHPKLKLVYHSDIWYDKSHLPVFNSLAVEANLHHIPNLSDIFVYFNDDLAVTKLLSLEDFIFNGNDRRIVIRPDFQLKIPPRPLDNTKGDAHYINSLVVTRDVLREICESENISKFIGCGNFVQHSPHVLMRSALYAAELDPLLKPVLEQTWAAKFRGGTELNTPTFFNTFVQCANLASIYVGSGEELAYASLERKFLSEYRRRRLNENLAKITDDIQMGKIKFLCVNDNALTTGTSLPDELGISAASIIQKWRLSLFPHRSSFEL